MSIRIYWLKKNIIASIIFFGLYLINRIIKSYINIPIIGYVCKCHLNDFFGGFLFCSYVNIVLLLGNRKPITNFFFLMLFMFGVSLSWEFIFPLFLSYSTSDFLDVVAYMLGFLTYYIVFCRGKDDSLKL